MDACRCWRNKGLEPISEEDAYDIIKELEDDEYDLVDGYVLCDFSGRYNFERNYLFK